MLDKTNTTFAHTVRFPSAELFSALERTLHATSQEETRHYLCGAFLHAVDGKMRLAATDGHRLCVVDLAADAPANFAPVIWPRQAMKDVVAAMRKAKAHRRPWLIQLDTSPALIRVTIPTGTENTTLDFVPIDGTFPDYLRVIPRSHEFTVNVLAEDFARAVSAVDGFVSALDHHSIKLTFAADTLKLSGSCLEGGATYTIATKDYSRKDEFVIGFNGRYLLDFANTLEGNTIEFRFSDAGSPTALVAPNVAGETYVLMPMRV